MSPCLIYVMSLLRSMTLLCAPLLTQWTGNGLLWLPVSWHTVLWSTCSTVYVLLVLNTVPADVTSSIRSSSASPATAASESSLL